MLKTTKSRFGLVTLKLKQKQLPALSLPEVNAILTKLEIDYSLYDQQIDGWCIWPIIRLYAGQELLNRNWDKKKQDSNRMRLQQKVKHIIRNCFRLFLVPPAKILVKSFTSALRGEMKGFYKDIFVDDLLATLPKAMYTKIGTMENHANFQSFLERSKNQLIPEQADSYTLEALASGIAMICVPKEVRQAAIFFAQILIKVAGLESFTKEKLTKILATYYWTKRFYSWLISRVAPEFVLISNHSKFPFVAAAREFGSTVIEMQHGSPNHQKLPYSWPEHAVKYKKSLPLPNKIFLFGDHFKEGLQKNNFWDDELVSVGSLQFDSNKDLSTLLKPSQEAPCTLLITTQGLNSGEIINLLSKFLELAIPIIPVQVLIKLHPNYDSNKIIYQDGLSDFDNVRVIRSTEGETLYDLFHQSDFHLSIFSTTHFEALAMGIQTLVFPYSGHEQMLPLVERGHAEIVEGADWLLAYILENKDKRIPNEVRDYYFRADAISNIKNELRIKSTEF